MSIYQLNEQEHGTESCLICPQETCKGVDAGESRTFSHYLKIPWKQRPFWQEFHELSYAFVLEPKPTVKIYWYGCSSLQWISQDRWSKDLFAVQIMKQSLSIAHIFLYSWHCLTTVKDSIALHHPRFVAIMFILFTPAQRSKKFAQFHYYHLPQIVLIYHLNFAGIMFISYSLTWRHKYSFLFLLLFLGESFH